MNKCQRNMLIVNVTMREWYLGYYITRPHHKPYCLVYYLFSFSHWLFVHLDRQSIQSLKPVIIRENLDIFFKFYCLPARWKTSRSSLSNFYCELVVGQTVLLITSGRLIFNCTLATPKYRKTWTSPSPEYRRVLTEIERIWITRISSSADRDLTDLDHQNIVECWQRSNGFSCIKAFGRCLDQYCKEGFSKCMARALYGTL